MDKCLILDLDGTISDCNHRMHLIEGSKKKWNEFFDGCTEDPLVLPVYDIVNKLSEDLKVVIITSRPERNRNLTVDWLNKHNIKFENLLMRKNNDFRKSPVIKSELLDLTIDNNFEPVYAFEDRTDCAEMFMSRGVFTFLIP
jgi:hypothetical protein